MFRSDIGGGMAYNARVHGKQSSDAFPHLDFWRAVAGLTADGMQYAIVTVKPGKHDTAQQTVPVSVEDPLIAGKVADREVLASADDT